MLGEYRADGHTGTLNWNLALEPCSALASRSLTDSDNARRNNPMGLHPPPCHTAAPRRTAPAAARASAGCAPRARPAWAAPRRPPARRRTQPRPLALADRQCGVHRGAAQARGWPRAEGVGHLLGITPPGAQPARAEGSHRLALVPSSASWPSPAGRRRPATLRRTWFKLGQRYSPRARSLPTRPRHSCSPCPCCGLCAPCGPDCRAPGPRPCPTWNSQPPARGGRGLTRGRPSRLFLLAGPAGGLQDRRTRIARR
jgi:hypothetical protein